MNPPNTRINKTDTPNQSIDSWLDESLRKFEVALFELVGDEFAPKQENGSPERKRLLGLLLEAQKLRTETAQQIKSKLQETVEEAVLDAKISELVILRSEIKNSANYRDLSPYMQGFNYVQNLISSRLKSHRQQLINSSKEKP